MLILKLYLIALFQIYLTDEISLIILDSESQEPLSCTSVRLVGAKKIYQTNGAGEVNLPVAFEQLSKNIYIAKAGYIRSKFPVGEFDLQKPNVIYLKRIPDLSEETKRMIESKDFRGFVIDELVAYAIDHFHEVAPNRPHELKGFFRQLGMFGDRCTQLTEAVLTIQDSSYLRYASSYDSSAHQINLEAIRQSKEQAEIDSVYIQEVLALVPKGGVEKPLNLFHKIYRSNYLRLMYDPYTLFATGSGSEFVKYTDLNLEEVIEKEGDIFFKIAFAFTLEEDRGNKSYLVIRKSDKAIVEFSRKQYIFGFLHEVKVILKQAKDRKYYPHSIELIEPRVVNRQKVKQYHKTQLFLYDLKFDFTSLDKNICIQPTRDVNLLSFKKSSSYWEEILQKHPELLLPDSISNHLSEQEPLEVQFQNYYK